MYSDSHAHLTDSNLAPRLIEIINRAQESEVELIVDIGTDLPTSEAAIRNANAHDFIFATVGVHPHDSRLWEDSTYPQKLREMAEIKKVVAIGEIGLDYHYNNSPRDIQKEVFRKQIRLAREFQLPIVVHSREAKENTLEILHNENARAVGGVMHCFSGDLDMATQAIEMGFFISFAGPITFKNYTDRDMIKQLSLERVLIETDSPYLTPHPFRGKTNEPYYVRYVAEELARIHNQTPEEIAEITLANAKQIFQIKQD